MIVAKYYLDRPFLQLFLCTVPNLILDWLKEIISYLDSKTYYNYVLHGYKCIYILQRGSKLNDESR